MTEARTELTFEDALNSLNGFDEIAIEKNFKVNLMQAEDKATTVMRAVIWVLENRTAKFSYNDAMSLSFGEVSKYFAEPEAEESEQGKEEGTA